MTSSALSARKLCPSKRSSGCWNCAGAARRSPMRASLPPRQPATEMAEKMDDIDELLRGKTAVEKSGPLYQKVREQLKQQIDRGFWKPGDMLPTEPELGEQFGVSAGTVKQALL